MENVKNCTKCSNEFPATKEHFFVAKLGKFGLSAVCKSCIKTLYAESNRKRTKLYYKANKEKISAYTKEYAKKNNNKIKKYQSEYRENHKEKTLNYNIVYRINNHEKLLEYDKERYVVRKPIMQKRQKDNRVRLNQQMRDYQKNNRERFKIYSQRRLTKKRNAESNYSLEEWELCKSHFNQCCAYCGKKRKLEQDHFIPLSNGGEYTVNNIIPACKSCNSSKSDKNFFEWYQDHPSYNKTREQKVVKYLNYKTPNTQQLTLTI